MLQNVGTHVLIALCCTVGIWLPWWHAVVRKVEWLCDVSSIQMQLFLQLFHLSAVQFHSRWTALGTTVVSMMAEEWDVCMATENRNCVSSRQVIYWNQQTSIYR